MRGLMLDKRISTPAGYAERGCLLVSYRLPLLRHCFVLCAENNGPDDGQPHERPSMEAMAFFLMEAQRLAQQAVGDPQAFMLIHSGQSIRQRANWHLHVFIIQHRWQKAWLYLMLGFKSTVLAMGDAWRAVVRSAAALVQ